MMIFVKVVFWSLTLFYNSSFAIPVMPARKAEKVIEPIAKKFQTLSIGQNYAGGIIFYLDETGQHGLVCSTVNLGRTRWTTAYNLYYEVGVRDNGIGAGLYNTTTIINYVTLLGSTNNHAAKVCRDYRGGGYADWYLPSRAELLLIYNNRSLIAGLSDTGYWSSTEYSRYEAWGRSWNSRINGVQVPYEEPFRKDLQYQIRAVRIF